MSDHIKGYRPPKAVRPDDFDYYHHELRIKYHSRRIQEHLSDQDDLTESEWLDVEIFRGRWIRCLICNGVKPAEVKRFKRYYGWE
jgi:hypothetical protein